MRSKWLLARISFGAHVLHPLATRFIFSSVTMAVMGPFLVGPSWTRSTESLEDVTFDACWPSMVGGHLMNKVARDGLDCKHNKKEDGWRLTACITGANLMWQVEGLLV